MFYLMYEDRLGLCPLNKKGAKVNRVLDIGCGTGNWTMDYGKYTPAGSCWRSFSRVGANDD